MDTYTILDADDAEWLGTWDQDAEAAMREADAAMEEAQDDHYAGREAAADAMELRVEGVGRDVSEARADRAYSEEPW